MKKYKKTINIITEKRSDAIQTYNQSLILNLKKLGANIKVVQFNNQPSPSRLINFALEIVNTIRTMFMINHDEIILFTDPISFNLLISLFIPNKKYVIFYHYEQDPFYYKFLPFISYQKVLNKLDGIICISQFSLSQLKSLDVGSKKTKVIYCGIDHRLFKPTPQKLYLFDYILSVGTEEPRKNMKNILKVFQILKKDFPRLKLLKIGKASAKNRQRTKYYVKKLGLTKSVIFTDFVEEKKLPQVYSSAKLLLFPSLLEGFGLPIVEAMACDCPVVTSNRNPMKELVRNKQATIDPLKPQEMAGVCKKILSSKSYRNKLAKNGVSRAKAFSWQKMAKEVYDFIS